MPDGVYDSEGVRLLAEALDEALLGLETTLQRRLGKNEKAGLALRIARDLLNAYDEGEHTPEGLRRTAAAAIEASGPPPEPG